MRPSPTQLRRWSSAATSPTSLARVRTAVGAVLLLAPQVLPQVLGVDTPTRARTGWLVQMVGVRELALASVVLASGPSCGGRVGALAGSACDLGDALVVGAAVRSGTVSRPWGSAVALSALGAGLVGLARTGRR